jgi:hypothetical protein
VNSESHIHFESDKLFEKLLFTAAAHVSVNAAVKQTVGGIVNVFASE